MDCFDKNIHIHDQNSTEFSVMNKNYPPMILNMLEACFPQNEINSKDYFGTPHQRVICLILTKPGNQVEIVGFCFIRQIRNDACFIHSVCMRKNRQGQKCCDRIFSYLVSNYGEYNLFLSVRVGKYAGKGLPENTAAIKCYSKNGFFFMDDICVVQADGLNCKMVRPKK